MKNSEKAKPKEPVNYNSWTEQEEAFFGSASWSSSNLHNNGGNGRAVGSTSIIQESRKKKTVVSEKINGAVKAFKSAANSGVRQLSSQSSNWTQYPAPETLRRQSQQKPPPFVPDNTGRRNSNRGSAAVPSSHTFEALDNRPSSKVPFLPPLSSLSTIANRVIKNCSQLVPMCAVCGTIAPPRYQYHPFFPKEIACITHTTVGKCTACGRYEPVENYFSSSHPLFVDLEDKQRKSCAACFRSVILDSQDIAPLWSSVVRYMDEQLQLFMDVPGVKQQMEHIPILIVGQDGLNDPSVRGSGHGESFTTRGMCMYEYRYHPLGGHLKEYLNRGNKSSSSSSSSRTSAALSSVRNFVTKGLSSSNVTAILCLKGLPRDLAGSILAHEATHAWFKLHPNYDPTRSTMSAQVEEGCCQLTAYLYLTHLQQRNNDESAPECEHDGQPTDKKLRQYFRFQIETDTSEVYGEGFRLAAAAYAKVGNMSAFLEHVATNQSFPLL